MDRVAVFAASLLILFFGLAAVGEGLSLARHAARRLRAWFRSIRAGGKTARVVMDQHEHVLRLHRSTERGSSAVS